MSCHRCDAGPTRHGAAYLPANHLHFGTMPHAGLAGADATSARGIAACKGASAPAGLSRPMLQDSAPMAGRQGVRRLPGSLVTVRAMPHT